MQVIFSKGEISDDPLVNACLVTYNQHQYISEAIDSILMQQTNFKFMLVIADDFSTDGTREVILNYQSKNPEKIIVILQEKNVGLAQNWTDVITFQQPKYIAYLEGDDYWTDPLKLQKQFDFLKQHPSLVLCFHDYEFINIDGVPLQRKVEEISKKDRTPYEMVRGCLIHQNTVMFRNVIREIPSEFYHAKNYDTFFIAYLSNWGGAGYIKDIQPLMYRIHSEGVWSSKSAVVKSIYNIHTLLLIKEVVNNKFHDVINYKVLSVRMALTKLYFFDREYGKTILFFLSSIFFAFKFKIFRKPKYY